MDRLYKDRTDKELLTAISARNTEAFSVLYDRYNRLLYKRVYGRLENQEQAREVMQELWISIWENPSFVKTDNAEAAKGFLYHYLSYRVLDAIRKEHFNAIAAATHESLEQIEEELSYVHVSEEYDIKELQSQIKAILKELPGQTAEIFVLHWQNGHSLKETAELLHLNERTVRQKSKEGIAILKKMVENGDIDSVSLQVVRNATTVVVYILCLTAYK